MLKAAVGVLDDIFSLAFPTLCLACQNQEPVQNNNFCLACSVNVPYIQSINDVSSAIIGKISLPKEVFNIYGLLYYYKEGISQKLLHQIKYYSKHSIAKKLGEELGEKYQNLINKEAVLVPVPLHPKRQHKRGFNQSMKIAEGMQKVLNLPIDNKLLSRKIYNQSQTKRNKEERKEILKKTFTINPRKLSCSYHEVILVDDVITTGSTLSACYDQIRKTQIEKVSIATLAITV